MKYNKFVIDLPIDDNQKTDLQERINHNQTIYYVIGICLGLGFALFAFTAGGI